MPLRASAWAVLTGVQRLAHVGVFFVTLVDGGPAHVHGYLLMLDSGLHPALAFHGLQKNKQKKVCPRAVCQAGKVHVIR